jgi:hypothetical protein
MSDETIPISSLFFDDQGPHVVRAGFTRPARTETYTPARGTELRALLDTSIVQLGAVSGSIRRRTPVPVPPPVAIDTLLYRGRAALDRALEIRRSVLELGAPPDRETIGELLDLVALAATE